MTHDGIKGMTLSYDLNGMPYQVRDAQGNLKAQYTYFADGEKYTQAAITQQNGNDIAYNDRKYVSSFMFSMDENIGTYKFSGANTGYGSFLTYKDTVTNLTAILTAYSVQDHLGRTRVITDASGNILERNDYYPFGLRTDRGHSYPTLSTNTLLASSKPQQLLYNGKELQDIAGTNYIDYGARMYDPVIARWNSQDPMADSYKPLSAYNYCSGNPINLVDVDGNKIIFVNGFISWIVGAPEAGKAYWRPNFIREAQRFFNDKKAPYYVREKFHQLKAFDAQSRRQMGYDYAKENLNELTQDLDEGETFKFVTHSMGAAFAEGMIQYLEEIGYKVETIVHINAYQASAISSSLNAYTIDYQNIDDWVIRLSSKIGVIKGANDCIRVNSQANWRYIHASPIANWKDFWDLLTQEYMNSSDNIMFIFE